MRPIPALLVFLLLAPAPASAWGEKAHAAIAALAEANLTPIARAQVKELLKEDRDSHGKLSGRMMLAEVASWADEIREVAPPGTYEDWHVRDNPVCGRELGPCKDGRCVDRNLATLLALLKDRNKPARARNEALKWVVHLVGDIHQPLHSGGNRDGNGEFPVVLEGMGVETTFHWAWDNEFGDLAVARGPIIGALAPSAPLPADAPARWMEETRQIARTHAYEPLPGFACGVTPAGKVALDAVYREKAVPVVREQLQKAGLRLAQLLNETLR